MLGGDLLEYALGTLESAERGQSRPASANVVEQWVNKLPEPWRGYAFRLIDLPKALWIGLFGAWLVLGIARRTVPFRLLPEDPWTLQRGRKLRKMAYRESRVLQVKEDVAVHRHVTRKVNEYGQSTGPDQVSTTTVRTKTLFVKVSGGGEDTVRIVNQTFDVREGHRLVEVFDAKTRSFLFHYNVDLDRYLFWGGLRSYVKMRPFILIPLIALCALLAPNLSDPSTAWVPFTIPFLYLVTAWVINSRRVGQFRLKMAPRLVEAARRG